MNKEQYLNRKHAAEQEIERITNLKREQFIKRFTESDEVSIKIMGFDIVFGINRATGRIFVIKGIPDYKEEPQYKLENYDESQSVDLGKLYKWLADNENCHDEIEYVCEDLAARVSLLEKYFKYSLLATASIGIAEIIRWFIK